MVTRIALLIIVFLSFAPDAKSCAVPPVQRESAKKALERADSIALVRIQSIEILKGHLSINLNAINVLKGNLSEVEEVRFNFLGGIQDVPTKEPPDWNSLGFLSGLETSISIFPDCTFLPSLKEGETYLYLNSDPVSVFILEKTSSEGSWYRFAQRYLESGVFDPISIEDYLEGALSYSFWSCSDREVHYLCVEGAASFMEVVESEHDRLYFPSLDRHCFAVAREFELRHGFSLSGLSGQGFYCTK